MPELWKKESSSDWRQDCQAQKQTGMQVVAEIKGALQQFNIMLGDV